MTAEEILKEATKRTLNIIKDSPLHKAIIRAMNTYADIKIQQLQIELLEKRESTGFNPETDKIFEKHLKELE